MKQSPFKPVIRVTHQKSKETGPKNIHKPSNNKKPIHEERRLQIEELDEWRTHKPRKHDKLKPRHDEPNSSKNQLQVGDKVLLDAADPRIATSEPNEETPLTVTSNFPYGTVEVNHPKFGTFKENTLTSNILTGSWNAGFLKHTRPGTLACHRPCTYHKMQHGRVIPQCENRAKISSPTWDAIIRKSSKAHPRIGTKNSPRKGSPRLPCPAQPRP
ncbi:hypothetical protein GOBAR_AA10910 [Gossypium barbadense]|uniref:Uncharacterized protein n=1 Tax=Gossypium barbadense TaxID=3634 RepID=A0A2P5Y2E0_GOSBA|nr:hypothetical protein GOBAR_AA10910 [Gossypium barbadense]